MDSADQTPRSRYDFQKGSVRSIALDGDYVVASFASGPPRCYGAFTQEIFDAWGSAPDASKWFAENVRKGKAHPEIEIPQAAAPKAEVAPAAEPQPRAERMGDGAPVARPAKPTGALAKNRAALDRINGRAPRKA